MKKTLKSWNKIPIQNSHSYMNKGGDPNQKITQSFLYDNHILGFSPNFDNFVVFDRIKSYYSTSKYAFTGFDDIYCVSTEGSILFIFGWKRVETRDQQTDYCFRIDELKISRSDDWVITCKKVDIREDVPYRSGFTAEIFKNILYIFGGLAGNKSFCDDLLIINLETSSYLKVEATGLKPDKRYNHSSLLHNGKMYIFGGISDKDHLNDIWTWDLTIQSGWKKLFPEPNSSILPVPRCLSQLQAYGDTLYFFKGENQGKILESLLSYEISSGHWKELTLDMTLPFSGKSSIFTIYNGNFFIGQDRDFYRLDLSSLSSVSQKNSNSPQKPEVTKNIVSGEMSSYFKQIFDEKLFCDITFEVEGEQICAHKAILAGRSSYFKKMLSSEMKESQNQIIQVPNIKAGVFKALLEFIYCDDTKMSEKTALDLLKLADEYMLDKLKENCATFLSEHIGISSAINILNAADTCEAFNLKKAALKFVKANLKAINEADNVSRLNKTLFFDFISQDL